MSLWMSALVELRNMIDEKAHTNEEVIWASIDGEEHDDRRAERGV